MEKHSIQAKKQVLLADLVRAVGDVLDSVSCAMNQVCFGNIVNDHFTFVVRQILTPPFCHHKLRVFMSGAPAVGMEGKYLAGKLFLLGMISF